MENSISKVYLLHKTENSISKLIYCHQWKRSIPKAYLLIATEGKIQSLLVDSSSLIDKMIKDEY